MNTKGSIPLAADSAGLSLIAGGILIFLGYFWPELTGWVWLASLVGPIARPLQAVCCVVAVVTGVGLLKNGEAARQVGAVACLLLGLAFLAVLVLKVALAPARPLGAQIASVAACAIGALYFAVLGELLRKPSGDSPAAPEPPRKDPPTGGPPRWPTRASALSLALGLAALLLGLAAAYDPKEGIRWARAIPPVMLVNAVGLGLGGAVLRKPETSEPAQVMAAGAGTILNVVPILAACLVLALIRRAHGA